MRRLGRGLHEAIPYPNHGRADGCLNPRDVAAQERRHHSEVCLGHELMLKKLAAAHLICLALLAPPVVMAVLEQLLVVMDATSPDGLI